ncbi:MAG: hypothetical protein V3V00_15690 [Saprospiraceae bacterium]
MIIALSTFLFGVIISIIINRGINKRNAKVLHDYIQLCGNYNIIYEAHGKLIDSYNDYLDNYRDLQIEHNKILSNHLAISKKYVELKKHVESDSKAEFEITVSD